MLKKRDYLKVWHKCLLSETIPEKCYYNSFHSNYTPLKIELHSEDYTYFMLHYYQLPPRYKVIFTVTVMSNETNMNLRQVKLSRLKYTTLNHMLCIFPVCRTYDFSLSGNCLSRGLRSVQALASVWANRSIMENLHRHFISSLLAAVWRTWFWEFNEK